MLFSKEGWTGLEGKTIGITDDTATSVKLLRVLLEKKHGVHARFERLHPGVNDYTQYQAVLLIGDEALRRNKYGLDGFELVFDLAREWYDWQKLPFVFAVWATRKSLGQEAKRELQSIIAASLEKSEENFIRVAGMHGRRIGLIDLETRQYLEGFNYRLGEREKESMVMFRELVAETERAAVS
jgi:chorismate dehydratase